MDASALFDTFAPMACCAFGGATNAIITTHVVLFVISVGMKIFDIYTDVQVIIAAEASMNGYQGALAAQNNYTDHPNRTYCYNSTFWQQNTALVHENIDLFGTLITASWSLFVLAVFLQLVYIIGTIIALVVTRGDDEEEKENREKAMKMLGMLQLYFTMIEDIPQNTIAIEFSWLDSGRAGLACWSCALTANCTDVEPLSLQNNQELFISLLVSFVSGIWDMSTSPMTLVFMCMVALQCIDYDDDDHQTASRSTRCKVRSIIGFGGIIGGVKSHVTNFALLYYHLIPDSALSAMFSDAILGMFILACVLIVIDAAAQIIFTIMKMQGKAEGCVACYTGCCGMCFSVGIMAGSIALAILEPRISWIFLIVASVLMCVMVLCMLCCCVCLGASGMNKIYNSDD